MNARWSSCVVDSSSSAQWGTSVPVSASMTIVGELGTGGEPEAAIETGIVSGLARPVTVAPAMNVSGPTPGEKPSESVQTCGFVWTFLGAENGNVFAPKATCLPVTVVGSSTSHTFDGNGNPQYSGTSGSQSVVSSGAVPSTLASAPPSAGALAPVLPHPHARMASDPKTPP